MEERAQSIYNDAIAIDGLNISNWESPAVYRSLSNGNLTAINATIAVWEGFEETMDHVAGWKRRFREMPETLSQVRSVDDILRAKDEGKVGNNPRVSERITHREQARQAGTLSRLGS